MAIVNKAYNVLGNGFEYQNTMARDLTCSLIVPASSLLEITNHKHP